MWVQLVLAVLVVGTGAFGAIVNFDPCNENSACTVHEVRIDPCREAPRTCSIKKGASASIAFDFTPDFSATNLKGMVYWANGVIDIPFGGMDSNACEFTSCPISQGQKSTYAYDLEISRFYPSSTYPIKWVLWNTEDSSEQCCFETSIKLKA